MLRKGGVIPNLTLRSAVCIASAWVVLSGACAGDRFEANEEDDSVGGAPDRGGRSGAGGSGGAGRGGSSGSDAEGGAGTSSQGGAGNEAGEGGSSAASGTSAGGAKGGETMTGGSAGRPNGGSGGGALAGSAGGGVGGSAASGGFAGNAGVGGAGGGIAGSGGTGGAVVMPWVYEPFNYPSGALENNGEGFGFQGAWFTPSGVAGPQVGAAGLSYSQGAMELVSLGRAVTMPTTYYTANSRNIDVSAIPQGYRDTAGKIGAPGTTIWLSYVGVVAQNTGIETAMGLEIDDGVGNGMRFIGEPWCWADFGPCGPNWGIAMGGTAVFSGSLATAVSLVVARFDFPSPPGGTARTRLWVNPNLADRSALGVADTQLDGADFRFTSIRVQSRAGMTIDEIRLGPSFESVTPTR